MKTNFILYVILVMFTVISCSKEKDETLNNQVAASGSGGSGGSSTGTSDPDQYTPDQANWETFSKKPFINGINTSHDPDGVGWITKQQWDDGKWDGRVYDPTKMTQQEFYKALFPHPDVLRGLREVFYKHNPFKDPKNPTKAEVDEWHRIGINHLRALVGYTSEDRKVKKDHCMFARALFGQERMHTTVWDAKYPGNNGSAYGPCVNTSNSHCGATFVPSAEDQIPYLPKGFSPCSTGAGSEGISPAAKSDIPWSIKWVRSVGVYVSGEGFWGGHTGPWFHREKFGFSFWDMDVNNNNSNAVLRAKWTGKLMPSLY